MNRKRHKDFLTISERFSTELYQAISGCGPLPKYRVDEQPLVTSMCRTIAGQQLSVQAARTIWDRVLADSGTVPLLEYLMNTPPSRLRACGVSGAKARAMQEIAKAADSGRLEPDALRRLPPHERNACLTGIWGVGPWTANMIGIFYFRDPDVWPESDITVQKTLQRLIGHRRKTKLAAEKFAPNRSTLARYMWKIADASPSSNNSS